MRAERLLRLMFLLKGHGKLTAGQLAARLGVSTRTVQRDLDALSVAGVPVYAERGRNGGWSLAADYRTRLDGLTPVETLAMFVGTAGRVLADLGLSAAADRGFAKLLSTLPRHARQDAEYARTRVLVDSTGWRTAPTDTPPWLDVLRRALWADQRVRVRYDGRDRTLAPLGLVVKGDRWYLVAAREDGQVRTYRVSRIVHAEPTGEGFTRPGGFDLAGYWEESQQRYFAILRDYPVRLWVRNEAMHRLSWAPNAAVDTVVDLGDGWSEVTATFEKTHETKAWLLGMAGDVVVREPTELREAMVAAALALVAQHAIAPASRRPASRTPADRALASRTPAARAPTAGTPAARAPVARTSAGPTPADTRTPGACVPEHGGRAAECGDQCRHAPADGSDAGVGTRTRGTRGGGGATGTAPTGPSQR